MYCFIECVLIHCVLAAVLCGFVPCLLEDGEEADEEIVRDCSGLS